MKEWIKEYKIHISIVFLVLILAGYYLFSPETDQSVPLSEIPPEMMADSEVPQKELAPEKKVNSKIMVDLKGAVLHPGVYEMGEGERVNDLIQRAGGFLESADQTMVNLAMYVADEMVLYIPIKGEISQAPSNFTGSDSKNGKVNINRADAAELETLPGIGPSKSSAIIEYRETTGRFNAVEDIQSISGIGEKTFEKLKDKISVD